MTIKNKVIKIITIFITLFLIVFFDNLMIKLSKKTKKINVITEFMEKIQNTRSHGILNTEP